MSNITFDEIFEKSEHSGVRTELNKFEENIIRNNASAKLVYDKEYNFYIDKDNGKLIKDGNYHSYTFRIERAETGRNIENVVFSYNAKGEYDMVIVRYNIENNEYVNLTEAELKQRPVQASVYNNQTQGFSSFFCIRIWRLTRHYPDNGDLIGQHLPEFDTWEMDSECFGGGGSGGTGGSGTGGSSGGGGGAGNGGGGNPGGGGNNGGGGNGSFSPIVTTPIVRPPNNINPCDALRAMLDVRKTNLNNYINNLRIRYNQGVNSEASYSFKTSYNENDSLVYSALYATGTPTAVNTTWGGPYYAAIHLHPKKSEEVGGIFSWQDVKNLSEMYTRATPAHQQDNDVAFMLFAPDPLNNENYNVYALTVNNITTLTAAVDAEWLSPKWARITDENKRREAIRRDFGKKYLEHKDGLERYFLDTFSGYGIFLYKLENGRWNKLSPQNQQSTGVVKLPCN